MQIIQHNLVRFLDIYVALKILDNPRLMKKVDNAIDTIKDNKSEQEREEKKQLEEKI